MFSTFKKDWKCSIPSVFFPTTVLHIDDDKQLLAQLSSTLSSHYRIETYSDPEEALKEITFFGTNYMKGNHLSLNSDGNLLEFRKAPFEQGRFKNQSIYIIDYDMPSRNGADLIYVSIVGQEIRTTKAG